MATAELGINIVARNQAKGVLKGLRSDLKGIQSSLGGVMKIAAGNLIATGLTAGINAATKGIKAMVGGFADASMAAAEFNAQISSIGAVAGATASELGQLKDLALDLGVDPNLKVSAVEAAQAIEMLARNGLKVPQIMGGAAKATVLLANATGADFATAADIGTDAMALFGIEANEMIKAVDGITSVTNNSKFSINDYRLALAQGGGVAATVGVEFDDFNTTIAAIAPLFGSGSDAGTSFKTFLQRMVPSTKPAITAMKELGLMTADGQNAFFDASGQMKSMAEVTGILNRATKDLTEEQKIHYLSTIFGTDAMRAAAGVAGMTEKDFRALQSTMGNTSATDAAAKRMDNLAGDMEIFKSVVESTRIQVGDEFQPALRDLYQSATSLLSGLAPIIVNFAGSIATGISGGIDNIREYKSTFDEIMASFGDNKLGGVLAAAGQLTGGTVTIDAEAQVVSVDWVSGLLGESTFTYDAESKVMAVDWTGGWLVGGEGTFTYDTDAKVLTVDWMSALEGEGGIKFVYDADAGIRSVDWSGGDNGFFFTYDADAQVTAVDFGVYSGKYSATVDVTEVLWGLYFHRYEATAGITDVVWGLYTHTYQPDAEVTRVLWGLYTYTYNTKAAINSVLWGVFTNQYTANAQIQSVLWGLYSFTYSANANVLSVLWGLYSHNYNAAANINSTDVFWGAWTNTYDVGAQVGENSILWGAFSWTYDANANIIEVLWGAFTNTYEAIANIKWPTPPAWVNWLMGWESGGSSSSAFTKAAQSFRNSGNSGPSPSGGGGSGGFNANGTDFWEGGWTWVGEEGPELLNLPRGSKILSNPDSKKMIGQMADGTGLPTGGGGIFDGFAKFLGFGLSMLDTGIKSMTDAQATATEAVAANTEAIDAAQEAAALAAQTTQAAAASNAGIMATTGEMIRVSAEQFAAAATQSGSFVLNGVAHFTDSFAELLDSFGSNLESALQAVPGLFGASQVTGDQMKMAELGIPQNFADDWLRRLTDEVVNGVDWEGVDIQDAAKRAGLDPSLPAEAILEMVTQKWNDKSLFADKGNLDLFNMDAVQQELMNQQARAAGNANILALFGITPEQATAAGVNAGTSMKAGVAQGLVSGATTGEGDASGGLASGLIGEIAPEQFASVGTAAVAGIIEELAKPENGKSIADALAAIFSDVKTYGDVFTQSSAAILTSIANGFATTTTVDIAGKLATAMRNNLALEGSVNTLKDIGERILEYVFRGYEAAAKDKDWAYATVGSGPDGGSTTTGATTATGNAIGTKNWRGGMTWVGETGPELVSLPRGSNIHSNSDSMDMISGNDVVNSLLQSFSIVASEFRTIGNTWSNKSTQLIQQLIKNTNALDVVSDVQVLATQISQGALSRNSSVLMAVGDLINVSARNFSDAVDRSSELIASRGTSGSMSGSLVPIVPGNFLSQSPGVFASSSFGKATPTESASINVTVNVASVANNIDIEAMAYRVVQAIQRRR